MARLESERMDQPSDHSPAPLPEQEHSWGSTLEQRALFCRFSPAELKEIGLSLTLFHLDIRCEADGRVFELHIGNRGYAQQVVKLRAAWPGREHSPQVRNA